MSGWSFARRPTAACARRTTYAVRGRSGSPASGSTCTSGRVGRARLRAGLTQHALAARAGTSQATISAYESGRKRPSLETLERVLAATGARLEVVTDGRRRVRTPSRRELARAGR